MRRMDLVFALFRELSFVPLGFVPFGFGSLNHGIWPLIKLFGTRNLGLQALKVRMFQCSQRSGVDVAALKTLQ